MEIHLIRHTKVVVPDSICFGKTDVDLRAEWENDFKEIVLDKDYNAIYSSPLKRCSQLTTHFFGSEFIKDQRIGEFTFGDWEMQPWDEIPPEQIDPWYIDFVTVTPPNGENLLSLQARVKDFMEEIQTKHENDKILIVTHSGVIRLILQYVLEFPIENMFRIQPQHGKKMLITKEFGLWKWTGMNV